MEPRGESNYLYDVSIQSLSQNITCQDGFLPFLLILSDCQPIAPTPISPVRLVHFYRDVFSVAPRGKVKQVAATLKAIHAQEDKPAALDKLNDIVGKLKEMKLFEAARKVEETGIETLVYMDFPREHWRRIRSNNAMERLNREIRRRTRTVGAFPDAQSALMLVCARLRHMEQSDWGQKTYLNMQHLEELQPSDS